MDHASIARIQECNLRVIDFFITENGDFKYQNSKSRLLTSSLISYILFLILKYSLISSNKYFFSYNFKISNCEEGYDNVHSIFDY